MKRIASTGPFQSTLHSVDEDAQFLGQAPSSSTPCFASSSPSTTFRQTMNFLTDGQFSPGRTRRFTTTFYCPTKKNVASATNESMPPDNTTARSRSDDTARCCYLDLKSPAPPPLHSVNEDVLYLGQEPSTTPCFATSSPSSSFRQTMDYLTDGKQLSPGRTRRFTTFYCPPKKNVASVMRSESMPTNSATAHRRDDDKAQCYLDLKFPAAPFSKSDKELSSPREVFKQVLHMATGRKPFQGRSRRFAYKVLPSSASTIDAPTTPR